MTLNEFIKKYTGQPVEEVDSSPQALNQCKDLVQRYIKLVLGFPYLPWGNAWEMFDKAQNDLYTKVKYKTGMVAPTGAIIIWRRATWFQTGYGKVGHIALGLENSTATNFNAFTQNDPKNSPCIIKNYTYKYVYGWLVPKVSTTDKPVDLKSKINSTFREVFGKNPSKEDNDYYLARVGKDILTLAKLVDVMNYWKSKGKTRGK